MKTSRRKKTPRARRGPRPAPVPIHQRLAEMMPGTSRRTLKQLVERGRVQAGGREIRRLDEEVPAGARITILPKRIEPPRRSVPQLDVVFEDAHLLVVDKPAGMLTVSLRRVSRPSVWSALRHLYESKGKGQGVFLVHRLDERASGLVVFARTQGVQQALKKLFARHEVDRHYAVIVTGKLAKSAGVFKSRLVEVENKLHTVRGVRRGDPDKLQASARTAVTRWQVRAEGSRVTAVEARLETGRKHQIRVQFAEAGHPVLGDRLYRGPDADRLMLHSWVLGLVHPVTGKKRRFVSRPGAAFDALVPGAFEDPDGPGSV